MTTTVFNLRTRPLRGGDRFAPPGRQFLRVAAWMAALAWWLWLAVPGRLGAQSVPVTGRIHFVVEDRTTGEVLQRGLAGTAGIAFDRLILPADRLLRLWLLEAASLRVAELELRTPPSGRRLELPAFLFRDANPWDSDQDGLPDLGEFIVGTNPAVADTDGDALSDGAEVRQGTDPLNGLAVRTGVIASAAVPGTAVDVAAFDDLAVLALRDRGVAVFNVFQGMNPVLVAQVDTPGDAQAVALGPGWVAVADGPAGLVVVDPGDPEPPSILLQLSLGAPAQAVAVGGTLAMVGLANGEVVQVDVPAGRVVARLPLGPPAIQDLVLSGDHLFVLVEGRLHVVAFESGDLRRLASVESPGGLNSANGRMRLFVGGGIAYPVHRRGYNTIDVSRPEQPRLLLNRDTPQFGWKQIVANGAGLGLAAVSPNMAFDGPHHVSVYDLRDPLVNNAFLAELPTPGVARSVAIYNGLGYVADHLNGLQVVNYRPYDALGVAPTIRLGTGFASGAAEEGKLLRMTAEVTDDVQVRNVEFYVDGLRVATDGNYPFEHRVRTPLLSAGRSSVVIRARASDTGGNATWSDELRLALLPDATPPRVVRTVPFGGALLGSLSTLEAYFSEGLDPAGVGSQSVLVESAGPDGVFGTGDDATVPGSTEYRPALPAVILELPARLGPGLHRLVVRPPLRDLAGNPVVETRVEFRVFSFVDADRDGMPDELEPALGLNPAVADSDGDGLLDGQEDHDGDGLPNAGEILAETDPSRRDTDGNGIPDGDEDPDGDALRNSREFVAGTLPLVADTDGDGWNDEAEVTAGSNPLAPGSRPRQVWLARPTGMVIRPVIGGGNRVGAGVFMARPPTAVIRPAVAPGTSLATGTTLGRPPVAVVRLSNLLTNTPRGWVQGRPPVTVQRSP